MNRSEESPKVENEVYEKIKFAVITQAAREFLMDADFALVEKYLSETVTLRLSASIWAHQDTESIMDAEQVPLTWWDGAKETLKEWLESHRTTAWASCIVRTINHRAISTEVKHWHVYPNVKFDSPHNRIEIQKLRGQDDN